MSKNKDEQIKDMTNTIIGLVLFITLVGLIFLPLILDMSWELWDTSNSTGTTLVLIGLVPMFFAIALLIRIVKKEGGGRF